MNNFHKYAWQFVDKSVLGRKLLTRNNLNLFLFFGSNETVNSLNNLHNHRIQLPLLWDRTIYTQGLFSSSLKCHIFMKCNLILYFVSFLKKSVMINFFVIFYFYFFLSVIFCMYACMCVIRGRTTSNSFFLLFF